MKYSTRIAILLAGLLVLPHPVSAPRAQGRDVFPAPEVPEILKAVYTLHGSVVPESLLVRGELEIEYRNLSPSGLREVFFALPLNFQSQQLQRTLGHCHVDSILLNGVPQVLAYPTPDSSIIRIGFDSPLAPDGKAFFLTSFVSRLNGDLTRSRKDDTPSIFSGFYPTVCLHKDWRWFLPESPDDPVLLGEYAQINIALSVDSAYTLVGTGHLINERGIYGVVPRSTSDTIIQDITGDAGRSASKNPRPLFPSGLKTYSWRVMKESGFGFVAGRKLVIDRILWDGRTIDLCYHRSNAKHLLFAAHHIHSIARILRTTFGTLPSPRVTILLDKKCDNYSTTSGLIGAPVTTRGSNLLWQALAEPLAGQWIPPMIGEDSSLPSGYNYGLAQYAALMAVRDRFGIDYWNQRHADQYLDQSPTETSRDFRAKVTIPSELYMLRFCIGERKLSNALRFFVADNRKTFCSFDDFEKSVRKGAPGEAGWLPKVAIVSRTGCDFALDSVEYRTTPEGGVLSFVVRGARFPVEIGIARNERDTLYDTLSVPISDTSLFARYMRNIAFSPKSVTVDPNQYFPDRNRANNCLQFDRSATCNPPEAALYPPYRRMKIGE